MNKKDMMSREEYRASEEIAKWIVRHHLKNAFNKYGIEGTEDKIKEIYKNHPIMKDLYLEEYYKIVRG